MATMAKSFTQPMLQSLWRRVASAVGSNAAALVHTAALSSAVIDENVDSALQHAVSDAPAAESAMTSDTIDEQAGGEDCAIDKDGGSGRGLQRDVVGDGDNEDVLVDKQAEVVDGADGMEETTNGHAEEEAAEAVEAIDEDALASVDNESEPGDQEGDNDDEDYEVDDDDGDEDYEVNDDEEEEDDDDDELEVEELDAGSLALSLRRIAPLTTYILCAFARLLHVG